MTTTISGSYPAVNSDTDATIHTLTVGLGTGSVANNTVVGYQALYSNVSGTVNNAFGQSALYSNQTGGGNTAIGNAALYTNVSGSNNVAVGQQALANATASNNTAVGYQSLQANTTATNNTALGYQALKANTTGAENIAIGSQALYANTTGGANVGIGLNALVNNQTGSNNVAIGKQALNNNTSDYNTAVGYQAGYGNTTGGQNTNLGLGSGYTNTTGSYNTFLGYQAGYTYSSSGNGFNTFVGNQAGYSVTSGTKNTILGGYIGNQGGLDIRTGSNRIVLSDGDGNPRTYINESGDAYFSTYTAGISSGSSQSANSTYTLFTGYYVTTAPSGTGTLCYKVTTNGNVYNTNSSYGSISDIKLKENIVNTSPKLDDLMSVRIVNYNLKEGQTHKQIGVIAQELEQIFPSMVEESQDFDKDGNDLGTTTKGVKYSVFVPMLIKALQELNAKFDAYVASHP